MAEGTALRYPSVKSGTEVPHSKSKPQITQITQMNYPPMAPMNTDVFWRAATLP